MTPNKNMRGGRLRKTARGIITFAPILLGAALPDAFAGTCTGTAGSYTCTGPANMQTDTTQMISGTHDGIFSITDEEEFSHHTQQGSGLVITTSTNSTGANIHLDGGGSITGNLRGIHLDHQGSGDVTVTTNTNASGRRDGILIKTRRESANMTAAINGTSRSAIFFDGIITTAGHAVRLEHAGTGTLTLTVAGDTSSEGDRTGNLVYTYNQYGTNSHIYVSGDMNSASTIAPAIMARHAASGSNNVTTNNNITARAGAIYAYALSNSEDVNVTVEGGNLAAEKNVIYAHGYGRDVNITIQKNATLAANSDHAIKVINDPTAEAVNIEAYGRITAAQEDGINVRQQGSSTVNIIANDVTAEKDGIYVQHESNESIFITANGRIQTNIESAIHTRQINGGNISITTNEQIHAGDRGIHAYKDSSTGDIFVTANEYIHAENAGIDINHRGAGNILVEVGGRIKSNSGDGISMSGGTTQRLIVRPGSSIEDAITASGDAILELADAVNAQENEYHPMLHGQSGNGTPSLPAHAGGFDLSTLNGFSTLEKTGNGLWELTGAMQAGEEFDAVSFTSGRLRLRGATLRLASDASLAVPDGGVLEVAGDTTLDGNFQAGGDLAIDLQLDNPGHFIITGDITGNETGSLEIRANGRIDPGTDINNIISVRGASRADAFSVDNFSHGAFAYELVYDATAKSWSLNESGFAPSLQNHEAYPAILTQLAQPSSMLRRFSARKWADANRRTFWGKVETRHTRLEPNGSTLGSDFDIEHSRARFGVDMPVVQTLNLDADITIGSAKTNLAATTGKGKIETDTVTASLNALWKYKDFYADMQTRFATFDNNLRAENRTLASGNSALAFSAAQEIGYNFEFETVTLTPQVQLIWSRVGFNGFEAPAGQSVSLKDGNTLVGRIGASAAGAFFRADANLRVPLDGRTSVDVSGVTFVNEIEDVAVDLGMGFNYPVDFLSKGNGAILFGDFETSQGDEIESYRVNFGLQYDF
ncbi:MAG: autotransporter outer membrane beta-barrel domain-containing protein [Hyphomicrobiales bacterium]|nr:autotransporter outer membrane beta-barrel domain-containing protein [Hyphomicrobiales bacterium]